MLHIKNYLGIYLFFIAISPIFAMTPKYPKYLHGAIVPMITPYKDKNAAKVDLQAMARFTDYLCTTRVAALFPVSGMGQWNRLSVKEKKAIIRTCVKAARKRKPVLAGIGSPTSIEEVLDVAKFAQKEGVTAVVIVTPSFIRDKQPIIKGKKRILDQSLLLNYYRKICSALKCSMFLYDPKGELEAATVAKLVTEFPKIIGIKYKETKDMQRFAQMVKAVKGKIAILSGSEYVTVATIKAGGVGMVGGGVNVYPNLAQDLVEACNRGDWKLAQILQKKVTLSCRTMGKLGGGAIGSKRILSKIIGVKMAPFQRGRKRRMPTLEEEKQVFDYFRKMNLAIYDKPANH